MIVRSGCSWFLFHAFLSTSGLGRAFEVSGCWDCCLFNQILQFIIIVLIHSIRVQIIISVTWKIIIVVNIIPVSWKIVIRTIVLFQFTVVIFVSVSWKINVSIFLLLVIIITLLILYNKIGFLFIINCFLCFY